MCTALVICLYTLWQDICCCFNYLHFNTFYYFCFLNDSAFSLPFLSPNSPIYSPLSSFKVMAQFFIICYYMYYVYAFTYIFLTTTCSICITLFVYYFHTKHLVICTSREDYFSHSQYLLVSCSFSVRLWAHSVLLMLVKIFERMTFSEWNDMFIHQFIFLKQKT